MRIIPALILVFLVACSPGEPETYTTSANIDDDTLPALLAGLDGLIDNELPVDELLELAGSTPMDEEKQQQIGVAYNGETLDVFIHVWREQADWVHFYASSTSEDLVNAITAELENYSR